MKMKKKYIKRRVKYDSIVNIFFDQMYFYFPLFVKHFFRVYSNGRLLWETSKMSSCLKWFWWTRLFLPLFGGYLKYMYCIFIWIMDGVFPFVEKRSDGEDFYVAVFEENWIMQMVMMWFWIHFWRGFSSNNIVHVG